jgi:hypothetical protein
MVRRRATHALVHVRSKLEHSEDNDAEEDCTATLIAADGSPAPRQTLG